MQNTTFRDSKVRQALEPFVKVKFRAEDPVPLARQGSIGLPGCQGLPTYVILVLKP